MANDPALVTPERITTRDGTRMVVRRMGPDDRERLTRMAARTSAESMRLRFFTPFRRLTDAMLDQLLDLDFVEKVAFVVTTEDGEVRGVGRLMAISQTAGEVAFIVEDEYQRHGLATELLHRLAAFARALGHSRLIAIVLAENREMREVFEHAGFPIGVTAEGSLLRVTMDIAAGLPPSEA